MILLSMSSTGLLVFINTPTSIEQMESDKNFNLNIFEKILDFDWISFLSTCKYSNSVSNKKIIANIFPLFSVAIYLIVITIKSSIVLSLGLVGALSIIRLFIFYF